MTKPVDTALNETHAVALMMCLLIVRDALIGRNMVYNMDLVKIEAQQILKSAGV